MSEPHEIWKIENSLWLDGVEAYEKHMADPCIMVFGPTGILNRQQILETLAQAPRWSHVDMTETTLAAPDDSAVLVIAYRAGARRDGAEPYRALCSSTYLVVKGAPLLVQHQQTPI